MTPGTKKTISDLLLEMGIVHKPGARRLYHRDLFHVGTGRYLGSVDSSGAIALINSARAAARPTPNEDAQ